MKPRLLDLFCGAGGAAKGYQRVGFYVVGVDIKPQPNYCGDEFVQADALDPPVFWDEFDAIHASPPCQFHTDLQAVARNQDAHEDLIGPTRELLEQTGLPYVIENVSGAAGAMTNHVTLCGTSFGLGCDAGRYGDRELRRHRLFETNWMVWAPPACLHRRRTVGIYGDHLRFGHRSNMGELSGWEALRLGKEAMGIDWDVTWDELKEAIPPAYTEFMGQRLREEIACQPAPR